MRKDSVSQLAAVFDERIKAITNRPDSLELGVIQEDLSLKLDSFAAPIKKGDYMVAEFTVDVTLPDFSIVGMGEYPVDEEGTPLPPETYNTPQTRWDWNGKKIESVKIELKPQLKAGDRVLVAWVNQHRDPIIICKVVSG